MKLIVTQASLREGSHNRKLAALAGRILDEAGHEVDRLDLRDFEVPAYDQDIQDRGFPANVEKFAEALGQSQGLVLASPEYNYSMPGHFKNLFDWVSRLRPMPWKGVPVLLMSASPSLVGGNRGLWALRVPFEACGAFVHPDMFSLASAQQAFRSDGGLNDDTLGDRLKGMILDFAKVAHAIGVARG